MPLKIAFFSTKSYDKQFFSKCNQENYTHEIEFFEASLNEQTVELVRGFDAVCAFVNDTLSQPVLERMSNNGVRLILMRCAGFNNVDIPTAERLGITILRVPSYSPNSVAEHAVAMMLALNRKIHKSYHKTREGNFTLHGLLGFDMCHKTVGIIGTGRIGFFTAKILLGFGCTVIAYDVYENAQLKEMGVKYVSLDELFTTSDIVSLHCPLMKATHHMINAESLSKMKKGVMIINTSRGGLIETEACIKALKSGKIGYLGLDVYEHEAEVFFEDWSDTIMQDDLLSRLTSFPNVLLTGHQAFFTEDALCSIAKTTLQNASDFEENAIKEDNQVLGSSKLPPKE